VKGAKSKGVNHKARFLTLGFFLSLLLLTLNWRMVDLMILDRSFLQRQGDARSVRVVNTPAFRGMILDRQGAALAVSTPVQSLWLNPKKFEPTPTQLKQLARLLGMTSKEISDRLTGFEHRGFIYLKRQLSPAIAQKIELLDIPGVNFQQEFKRYYPDAESTSQLLGFTNIDDDGLEGLELAYQGWLNGVPGKRRVMKDRTGRIIDGLEVIQEPKPDLTEDIRFEFVPLKKLIELIEKGTFFQALHISSLFLALKHRGLIEIKY